MFSRFQSRCSVCGGIEAANGPYGKLPRPVEKLIFFWSGFDFRIRQKTSLAKVKQRWLSHHLLKTGFSIYPVRNCLKCNVQSANKFNFWTDFLLGTEAPGSWLHRRLSPVSAAWSDLEYFYSPLDGMLVHRRVTPAFSPVPIYTRVVLSRTSIPLAPRVLAKLRPTEIISKGEKPRVGN